MHQPRTTHLTIVKRILRFVKGTISHSLRLQRATSLHLITLVMQTGLLVPSIEDLNVVIVSTLVKIMYLDHQENNLISPDPPLNQSTEA